MQYDKFEKVFNQVFNDHSFHYREKTYEQILTYRGSAIFFREDILDDVFNYINSYIEFEEERQKDEEEDEKGHITYEDEHSFLSEYVNFYREDGVKNQKYLLNGEKELHEENLKECLIDCKRKCFEELKFND